MLLFCACAGPGALQPSRGPRAAALTIPPLPSPLPATEELKAQSDRERLQNLIAQPGTDAAVANGLARFLPTVLAVKERPAVYGLLGRAYAAAVAGGAASDAEVEAALCGPQALEIADKTAVVTAAYRLASAGSLLSFVDKCLALVTHANPGLAPPEAAAFARLQGTVKSLKGDVAGSLEDLRRAGAAFDLADDPNLHLRLVTALIATGSAADACPRARRLYAEHPLLPGARASLSACAKSGQSVDTVIAEIDTGRKARLLAGRRDGGEPAKALALETDAREVVDLELKDPDRLTVAVFFSTWCPHCNKELPRINQLVATVGRDARLNGKVRILGVRTSIEREAEPYEAFIARLQPAFPIWTDPTMSLAFASFCKHQGLKPALPTVAVVDTQGLVRYVLGSGDYQNSAQELFWALQSLLDQQASNKP